jgi:TRAP-type C4-dicarboxylate transport system substrate-binding protein
MIKRILTAVAACTLLIPGPSVAKELRYSLFISQRSIEARILGDYFKQLSEATKGALTGKVFAGGQLLGPAATLRGIRDGVVDMGFIVAPFTQAELKHLNVVSDLVAYAHDSYATAAAASEMVMVKCKECRDEFAAQKSIFLGGHATTPWNLMCAKPVESLADLRGRKVRVVGASATRLVGALGMVGVQMSPAELSSALSGGQIDCAVGPAAWLADYGLWDSVKVLIEVDLGISGGLGLFVVNERSIRSMDAKSKAAFVDLMPKTIADGVQAYIDQSNEVRNAAQSKGVKFVKPAADILAALEAFRKADLPNVAKDIAKRGVKDPDRFIKYYLDGLKDWHAAFEAQGHKPDVAAKLLRERIFSKVKLP